MSTLKKLQLLSAYNISVIIPNYNHAAYLKQRIDSVLNQTFQPAEIIILDDCSTDNSVEIIEEYVSRYPNIRFEKNEFNSGSTFAQWNKGVGLAKGDLVWIAESDDTADPTFLQQMIACFNDHDVVLAYCQSNRMDKDNNITGTWKTHTDEFDECIFSSDFVMDGKEYIERFLIHKNTIPNASAVVFKRKLYLKLGLTELPLRIMGDWLMWIKILSCGKVAFISQELNSFRFHSQSAIAKSVEIKKLQNLYDELYGISMRECLINHIKKGNVFLSDFATKENKKYCNLELANMGLLFIKNRDLIKGWKLIFLNFFVINFNPNVIKRAVRATVRPIKKSKF